MDTLEQNLIFEFELINSQIKKILFYYQSVPEFIPISQLYRCHRKLSRCLKNQKQWTQHLNQMLSKLEQFEMTLDKDILVGINQSYHILLWKLHHEIKSLHYKEYL